MIIIIIVIKIKIKIILKIKSIKKIIIILTGIIKVVIKTMFFNYNQLTHLNYHKNQIER